MRKKIKRINNLKSFYYAPKTYFKELFNVNFIKNNLSNILSSVKGVVNHNGNNEANKNGDSVLEGNFNDDTNKIGKNKFIQ